MTAYINLKLQLNIYFFKKYFQWSKTSRNLLGDTRIHQVTGTQTSQRFTHKFIQTSVNKTIRNQTKFQNTGQTHKATISSLLYFINRTFITTCQASTATLFMVYKIPVTFFLFLNSLNWNASFPTNYFSPLRLSLLCKVLLDYSCFFPR